MPKATHYRLNWHAENQTYELHESTSGRLLLVTPEEPEWFEWLDTVSSFTFSGKLEQFTVRKESRQWGDRYWYAYRRVGSKLTKKYLGRTTDLTLTRLEEIAALFADQKVDSSEKAGVEISLDEKVQDQRRSREATQDNILAMSGVARISPSTRPSAQHDQLLTIKLHRPRPHNRLVSRSRLVERIKEGTERALLLISAPAGFGKTTLLAQCIAVSDTPVAWLTLEQEENDPMRFLAYLISALQTVDDRVGANALELLHTPQPPLLEPILALLTNDLMRFLKEDIALILDDYHVITAEPIHRAMTYLLEHLPPQLHLVLATRADPPLPLSRLRARGQLVEVRAAELRMNATEAHTFLHTIMGLDLSPDDVDALESRTEGWIVGLQLAALSLHGRTDVSSFLSAFTGSHRFVLDYLSDEVLSQQAASVQAFLLHTSVLERLSGPLCDAVTGREGSQAILEALERENLFVVSLDDERRWYRYHNLFSDFLKSRLQQTEPSLVSELHHRASIWFEQQGLPVEAIQHALVANAVDRAADLIEQNYEAIALRGQVPTVLDWLNLLPDALVRTRPKLCIYHADLLMFTNQIDASELRLQDAEHCLQADMPEIERQVISGKIAVIRAVIARNPGDFERSVSIANKALDLLPETEKFERASAMLSAAHAFLVTGDVTATSVHQIETILAPAHASKDLYMVLRSIILLARLQVMQGQLKKAATTYEEAVRVIPEQEILRALSGSAAYYFGIGDLLRECNKLDVAEQYIMNGMDLVKGPQTVFADDVAQGHIALARLLQAQSDYGGAISILVTFAQLARQRRFVPHLLARSAAVQTQMELARNNLEAINHWLDTSDLFLDDELSYQREQEYLTLARVRIAQGRKDPKGPSLSNAMFLLDRLLADAESKARMNSILVILILQSLALSILGESVQALTALERALIHAAQEGYIRLFVDEGKPMLTLLRQAQEHGITPHYTATLLSAFGEPALSIPDLHAARVNRLIEPLTEREREVLGLLLEGASNREIAHQLVLSINTVKRHIYNICGKLGVKSRTQVLAKARTLNLL
ncbi:MAG: LuxR C-terminal-related transcriptional regulator [Ktedonobacteraceae bacterium]